MDDHIYYENTTTKRSRQDAGLSEDVQGSKQQKVAEGFADDSQQEDSISEEDLDSDGAKVDSSDVAVEEDNNVTRERRQRQKEMSKKKR